MADHALEQRLMKGLVDGLVGWTTYYQASSPSGHVNEQLFYEHIDQIARGRGWKVKQQHPLTGTGAAGAPSTLDFVFYRLPNNGASRAGVAFVEVKYLRGDNPSQDLGYLWADIEKLRNLQSGGLERSKSLLTCGEPAKFLLVVGQVGDLKATAKCKPRTAGKQRAAALLKQALQNAPPSNIYWSEANTYLHDDFDWRAMAIGSRRWPDPVDDE